MEHFKTFYGPLSQEWIDRRYWSPALICHANQSNEYYITLIQVCIEIISQQLGCIGKSRNIPGLKQRNLHEERNPSMKSQVWNPQTCSRVDTSPKANRSHLPYSIIAQGFLKPIGVTVIRQLNPSRFMLRKTVVITHKKNKHTNKQKVTLHLNLS